MSRVLVALAFALLAVGCEVLPGEAPVMAMYPDELETAIATWSETYDVGPACHVAEVTTVVASEHDGWFQRLCGPKWSERKGCISRVDPPARWVLVIREGFEDDSRNIITHEAMHWLAICSGVDTEDGHDDPLVWDEGGILARTNEALRLPSD